MICESYNTGSLLDTSWANISKMDCYLGIDVGFYCKENITHLHNINRHKLLIILDDHLKSADIVSASGLPLVNKIYFNEPIVQIKTIR